MVLHVYEAQAFKESEVLQMLLYFESVNYEEKNSYTFESFIKQCMAKEIVADSFYTLDLISNRKDNMKMIEQEYRRAVEYIDFDIFFELYEMFDSILKKHQMTFGNNIKKAVRIYDHEWDYLFYVIEDASGFYGYNWTKRTQ